MPFRLRHQQHNFELGQGEFVIGRSAECQLALDDPLVSRKHAVLVVGLDSVMIKDLGSRNGVVVNGAKIDTSRVLVDGDRIVIGSQEMTVIAWQRSLNATARRRAGSQTLSSVNPAHGRGQGLDSMKDAPSVSKRVDSFRLLSTLADKALALGRPDDAERILAPSLGEILKGIQEGLPVSSETADLVAQYAVRLATGTGKGSWVDYVVAIYTALRRPCPGPLVDELNTVVRKTSPVNLDALRAYLGVLRDQSSEFGPTERFLLQRIEGLERLASLK
jgi:pSer/pThr/pTyr-binding forkhead associated (FHA) protein